VVARRYEALRARRVLALWRHAADIDAEDFGIVEELLESAERLAVLVLDDGNEDQDGAVMVCGFVSDRDGVHVVQIDTREAAGRVRVVINDGIVYDGDPEMDVPPGARYCGAVWADVGAVERCDECGAATEAGVSAQHGPVCSLHPDNCVGAQRGGQR